MIENKKSQEEMVGFVLIIVVVSVIALVLLGIFLRQSPGVYSSNEAVNFLHSSLLYTTDCQLRIEETYNLRQIVKACAEHQPACINGDNVCDVLTRDFTGLLDSVFQTGELGKYNGYELKITSDSLGGDIIQPITAGSATGNMKNGEVLIEDISISLKLYQ